MCITFLKISTKSKTRFVLGFNREVEISKPTSPLAQWSEDPNILGGRDLVQKGHCLALNKQTGNIAILTNYSDGPGTKVLGKLSRGDIVRNFVATDFFQKKGYTRAEAASKYVQEILSERHLYLPFNLIVGNLFELQSGFFVLDFTMKSAQRLPEDQYFGMSNSSISSPYTKTVKGVEYLQSSLTNPSLTEADSMEAVLKDTTYHKHHDPYDHEDRIFVLPFKIPSATLVIGTISSTIITLTDDGVLQMTETYPSPQIEQ